ncbi:MAG: hypothetical protein JXR27_07695 [Paludibacteraceae bacterium]|nr:hypothetical protein [Paludibacteraceae bacterium]
MLKIIGISLVLKVLNVISQSIATLSMLHTYQDSNILAVIATTILTTLAMYFFILWLFVIKTEWLVNILNLEKGFDENRIDMNFKLTSIVHLSIIITGAILIITNLPHLCKEIINYIGLKNSFNEQQTATMIILYFIKAVLGYALITNSKKITLYIDKKTVNTDRSEEVN